MSNHKSKAGDETVVSGLGLSKFRDDDLSVQEPCAASTAGHKTSRRDLLEKRCNEYLANLNLPEPVAEKAFNAMPPPTVIPRATSSNVNAVGIPIGTAAGARGTGGANATIDARAITTNLVQPGMNRADIMTQGVGCAPQICLQHEAGGLSNSEYEKVFAMMSGEAVPNRVAAVAVSGTIKLIDGTYAPCQDNEEQTVPQQRQEQEQFQMLSSSNDFQKQLPIITLTNLGENYLVTSKELKSSLSPSSRSNNKLEFAAVGSLSSKIPVNNNIPKRNLVVRDNSYQLAGSVGSVPCIAVPQLAGVNNVSKFSSDMLESYSVALGDISPPKSLAQRLREVKQHSRVEQDSQQRKQFEVLSDTRVSGATSQNNSAGTATAVPDPRQTCSDAASSVAIPRIPRNVNLDEWSGSAGLLSSSVLRQRTAETSETWLLNESSHQLLHSEMDVDGEASLWDAAALNYTASDVPWNKEERNMEQSQDGDIECNNGSFGIGVEDGATAAAVYFGTGMEESEQLAELMADEQFGELDLQQLEEDERNCNSLSLDAGSAGVAEMTGLCGVDEITVRESWLGPSSGSSSHGAAVRRMPVDEYLKTGSCGLGSLSGNSRRPSFGLHCHATSSTDSLSNQLTQFQVVDNCVDSSNVSYDHHADMQGSFKKPDPPLFTSSTKYHSDHEQQQQRMFKIHQQEKKNDHILNNNAQQQHSLFNNNMQHKEGLHQCNAVNEGTETQSKREPKGKQSDIRTRGDGGSIGDVGSEETISSTLQIDDLCTPSQYNVSNTQAPKTILSRSASVNVSVATADRVPVSKYGSLGRALKVKQSVGGLSKKSQSKSQFDVSKCSEAGGQSAESMQAYLAHRNLDTIKNTLSNMTNTISPQSLRAHLLAAVAEDDATNVTAMQDSVFDASLEVQTLVKQKEMFKQRFAQNVDKNNLKVHGSHEDVQGNKGGLHKILPPPLLGMSPAGDTDIVKRDLSQDCPKSDRRSHSNVQHSNPMDYSKPNTEKSVISVPTSLHKGVYSNQEILTPQRGDHHPGGDVKEASGRTSVRSHLDDTIRLERCSPSVTTSYSKEIIELDELEKDPRQELEETPALHTLSICDGRGNNRNSSEGGNSVCMSPEVHVGGCVAGVATWLSIPLYNPSQHYIKVWATIANELLNKKEVQKSSILFQQGCLLEPGQNVVWALGICGRHEGMLQCVLKLKLVDMSSSETLITHLVPIAATVNLPQVTIANSEPIDVGTVPEGFLYDYSFDVYNKSERALAVIISLSQVFSSLVFRFKEQANKRLVSESEVACVLPPGKNTFPISIMAPNLSNVSGEAKDTVRISCKLTVKLDSPELPRPVLACENLSVAVVAVHLHVSKSCMPLLLETTADSHASASLTLKNLSCIPLSLSFKFKAATDGLTKESLAVVPDSLIIQPNTQASPVVVFSPLGVVTQCTASIIIVVEPYGLEYEVTVHATSHLEDVSSKRKNLEDNSFKTSIKCNEIQVSEPPSRTLESKIKPTNDSEIAMKNSTNTRLEQQATSNKASALSCVLEATKSRLVFGCIKPGTTVTQKVSFFNRNNNEITLSLVITGSPVFSVLEPMKGGYVVVPGNGTAAVVVAFCPHDDSQAYSAALVCKPRAQQRIKYTIEVQGYGGCGVLQAAERELLLPAVSAGCPAIVRLALHNTASRALCVTVTPFKDSDCTAVVPSNSDGASRVMVQPEELVLSAGDTQDIVVIVCVDSGSAFEEEDHASASKSDNRGQSLLATLQLQYSEELLRRRYRSRLQANCTKTISARESCNTTVVDWDRPFRGEKLAAKCEDDSLPSQPDDGKLFLASFRKLQVSVLCSFMPVNAEASVTCFAPLIPDMTLSETVLHDRDSLATNTRTSINIHNAYNYVKNNTHKNTSKNNNDLNKPATHTDVESKKEFTFNVEGNDKLPTDLENRSMATISESDCESRQILFPVSESSSGNSGGSHGNLAAVPPMKKVLCNVPVNSITENMESSQSKSTEACGWSSGKENVAAVDENNATRVMSGKYSGAHASKLADPKEGTVVEQQLVSSCIEVFPKELSLQVGGRAAIVAVNKTAQEQNIQVESSDACLRVQPSSARVPPNGSVSVQLLLKHRHTRLPNCVQLKVLCNNLQSIVQVCCVQLQQSQEQINEPVQQPPTATAAASDRVCVGGLEIGQSVLTFPITAAGKQSHVKLSLKNPSPHAKQVLASVTAGSGFVVKHPHFQVKVGHFVNIPVYFTPRTPKEHHGFLKLVVGKDCSIDVALRGSCV